MRGLLRAGCFGMLGSIGYGIIEILWRGHTHWTMVLLGGLCFLCIGWINRLPVPRMVRYLLCAAAVSLLELATGCLVNLRLGWAVWDYSANRLNLWGQICPLFCFLWLLLAIPSCALASWLDRRLNARPASPAAGTRPDASAPGRQRP